MGPFEWQDEDDLFVEDGLIVTGIILAGIFLLVVSFVVIHLLRRLGFCYGARHLHPQSVSDEYMEYRRERLDNMYAHVSRAGVHRSAAEWASHNQHAGCSRLSSCPIPSLSPRDCHEQGTAFPQGLGFERNPHSGRLTYIRFSPSGIWYTDQSILVPSSGVRRHYTERLPVLPHGSHAGSVDMQRLGHRGRGYSPQTNSFAGNPYVPLGMTRDTTNGRLAGEGLPPPAEGCSTDHECARESGAASAVDAPCVQRTVELFTCPITHEVMEDPVMAADGYTYERKSIMQWLKKYRRSPMTNEPMAEVVLIANHGLKSAIQEWESRVEDGG